MKMINKILITLLIIAMAASLLPMALAAESDYTAPAGETVALEIDLGLSYGFQLEWKNVTYSNPAIIDRANIQCDGSKMKLAFGQVMDNGVWYMTGTKPTEKSVFILNVPVTGTVGDTCTITLKYELCFDGVHPALTTKTFTIKIVEGHIHAYEWKYNDNQHWQECSCGDVINTGAHTWEWVIDKAAGEFNTGLKHEACKTCGATRNNGTEIPATHQCAFGDWKFNATKHWKECSCGERIDEGNHEWEWVIDKTAGEFEVGQKHEKCSVCGAVRNEGTDIPGTHTHSYGEWMSNANNHWKECSCGERTQEGPHRWSWVIDKEATQTTSGVKHEECTVCGRVRNEGTVIPAKHDCAYGDWKYDDENHWKECSCGAKAQEGPHVFGEWVTTKYPTETKAGVKERKCTVCDYKQTKTINPTGGEDPTTPTTPVNPTVPTDPSAPTTPTDPSVPTTPTTPGQPTTPTTPVQPADGGEEKGPCLWWLLILLILALVAAWYFLVYKKNKKAAKPRRTNPLDKGNE